MVEVVGGLRVGIVGVTTERIAATTLDANFQGLTVTPMARAMAREAEALRRRGAQVILAVAHAGASCQSFQAPEDLSSCSRDAEIFDAARALPPGLVDAIVAGHSHGGVAHRVNGIPIVEAYAHGQAFARVDLLWDPRSARIVGSRLHRPTPLRAGTRYEGRPVVEDALVGQVAASAVQSASPRRHQPLGVVVRSALTSRYDRESPLGNLVASLMLESVPRARVALIQAGGIRADLPQGPLQYGSLYDALPFQNRLAVVTLTGRGIREIVARNLGSSRGIFSLAGLRVSARCQGIRLVVDALLLPASGSAPIPLGDEQTVKIVVTDFLASGGDGFPGPLQVEIVDEPPTLREAIAERLRARGGVLDPADWHDPARPRLRLPSLKPLQCGSEGGLPPSGTK
jgi:5'-nucleotidase